MTAMKTSYRVWLPLLGLVLAGGLMQACTPLSQREMLENHEWRQIAASLEQEASADALLAAALLHSGVLGEPARALELLDRTQVPQAGQPEAAWLSLLICMRQSDCDTESRRARLLALDSGNAAAHLPALSDARKKQDPQAEDAALLAMAKAEYFDLYWSRLVTRTADALDAHRQSAMAVTDATGLVAALAIPPFLASTQSCRGERLQREEVLGWCRQLAGVFDRGDTIIAQKIGLAIARQVWPAASPELVTFQERERQHAYLLEKQRGLEELLASEESTRQWLSLLRSNRDEREVQRQRLAAAGIAPEPPADWRQ